MKEKTATTLRCPFGFVESLGDFIFCVGSLCMSWSTVGQGYCKRLNAEENIHVRYRPVEG